MVPYKVLKGLYSLEKTIGCGGFAKVKLATHIATGEKVAIKIMDKISLNDDLCRVKLELNALKSFSHPHISKLFEVIETETHFFIVIEYCSGGELFDHIVEKNRLSEAESRKFFRQIVSAVAYLHSHGYAHRDIKPENILLDQDQSLKLIDFGLCAKPNGGMQNPLFTSCGSPAYAAPELVMGRPYLGQEVDVWAMGVLLYTLLAGYLPFDDQTIDTLYKQIMKGKYDEPTLMSLSSRRLIRAMLQVDPKKRITIKELLSHPWLTMGTVHPIQVCAEDIKRRNDDCLLVMSKYYGIDVEELWGHLKKWNFDYETATYFLLQLRKRRRASLKLYPSKTMFSYDIKRCHYLENISRNASRINNRECDGSLKPLNDVNINELICENETVRKQTKNPNVADVQTCGNSTEPTKTNLATCRKPIKRIRSPTLEVDSPVPSKKSNSAKSTPKTPEWKRPTNNADNTPASTRKMFGSIERSLKRVRYVLTPRKASKSYETSSPVLLTCKDICNVSTTQCYDPEYVITELGNALEKKGIECERRGFTIRGKVEPNPTQRVGGCSFELEICYLPSINGNDQIDVENNTTKLTMMAAPTKSILRNGLNNSNNNTTPVRNITYVKSPINPKYCTTNESNGQQQHNIQRNYVGIRRKRLKGDSWCYKKVCEEVLALNATEFKPALESAV